jgi:hypothetical protein
VAHAGGGLAAGWASEAGIRASGARNLPVVVLVDGHRPPLINCVDDIDFGFEGKLKRPHGHLVVFRWLLLRNVVLRTVREHIPGRLRGGAGDDRPGVRWPREPAPL